MTVQIKGTDDYTAMKSLFTRLAIPYTGYAGESLMNMRLNGSKDIPPEAVKALVPQGTIGVWATTIFLFDRYNNYIGLAAFERPK